MDIVQYHVEERVAIITLNRPEQRNAQNFALLDALDAAWTRAAEDEKVRVILLRANGPHFSAGHDMNMANYTQAENDAGDIEKSGLIGLYNCEGHYYMGYSRKWRDVPKPSIAAVQGACIAAGLMLAWPCDLIIAADNAKFSDPVIRLGIGGVEYHAHTWEMGARKAKEMLFTARSFNAEEARQIGMVNKVVPLDQLQDEALKMAHDISQHHPFALAMAKRAVNQTLDIQGQHNSIQAAFDMHQLAHANAALINEDKSTVLLNHEQMVKAVKASS
jgi:enoyl-CoA hydratase